MTVTKAIDSWERTRWTVAHELGHIALHHGVLDGAAELTASMFASELLAPAEVLANELPAHVTLRELVPLKLRWGISIGALILHLRRHELIAPARAETLEAIFQLTSLWPPDLLRSALTAQRSSRPPTRDRTSGSDAQSSATVVSLSARRRSNGRPEEAMQGDIDDEMM